MIPDPATLSKLFEFTGALSIVTAAMAWWRKDTPEEDATVVAATDLVLETLSDGDTVARVECVHHRNMRDVVTVEEAQAMHEEAELRRWGWKRN